MSCGTAKDVQKEADAGGSEGVGEGRKVWVVGEKSVREGRRVWEREGGCGRGKEGVRKWRAWGEERKEGGGRGVTGCEEVD